MSVSDWLRNLRLHKYSEVFKGKTFDEVRFFTIHVDPCRCLDRSFNFGEEGPFNQKSAGHGI